MKPASFDFHSATSLDDAMSVMFDHIGDARVIAGGQSLVPMLNMRLLSPKILVDINGIESLATIESNGSHVEVGANIKQCDLLDWPVLHQRFPLLAKALPFVGHVQTRNRGTVCGSIAHADPSSELPLCLAVLGGEVVLQSKKGKRTLKSDEYQWGMLITARRSDELITMVRFPEHLQCGTAFKEVARCHGDFAIVAFAATADEAHVRLGVGGVADRPEVREWQASELNDLDAELNDFAWQLKGYDDIHATARYRRELVRRLGKQVIEEAMSCRP